VIKLLFIALGGAVGAASRWGMSLAMHRYFGNGFAFGTLSVNVAGSFLIGLLSILFFDRLSVGPDLRALILIGFLGAFTTFSTFSWETLSYLENGQLILAGMNVLLNVCLCLCAVWLGMKLGRIA